AARGALLTEMPPGVPPAAWRFAVRNRIVASISHVVVVVESHKTGGALLTAVAATERGKSVMAVPGSIQSAASEGTNALIADGASPALGADHVLTAVELAISADHTVRTHPDRSKVQTNLPVASKQITPMAHRVLGAVGHDPSPVDDIVGRCGLTIGQVSLCLEQLADAGMARENHGWWSQTGNHSGAPHKA
ncbi:MAG TPA: DNA-processing protein DprA, partial [Acidimicrobiales bacterium]|nr:DNA-processing protein DprA [Acidimicrobiales bacterium]